MVGLIEENKKKDKKNIIMKKIREDIDEDLIKINHKNNNNITVSSYDHLDEETTKKTLETSINPDEEMMILETVKVLLNEVLSLVENNNNNNGDNDINKDQEKLEETDDEIIKEVKHKGILKHEKAYSNKHVDFDLALQYIPSYDPKKDYTIEIEFVETIKKKVVSYAALFAKRKAEEAADEEAAAKKAADEEEAAIKAAEEEAIAEEIPQGAVETEEAKVEAREASTGVEEAVAKDSIGAKENAARSTVPVGEPPLQGELPSREKTSSSEEEEDKTNAKLTTEIGEVTAKAIVEKQAPAAEILANSEKKFQ